MKHLYYGWVMVAIAAGVLTVHSFIFFTFGIFLRPITMEFGWERGAVSAALSMNMLAGGLLAILTGILSDKYGPRLLVTANGFLAGIGFILLSRISSLWQVYLIWGLLMSVAGSCCYIPIASTIPRWFATKGGIAMGLTVSGFALGGMLSPILTQWLISSYGWRQAYIVLGVIIVVITTPLAQFMKHSPHQIGLESYGESGTIEDKQSLTPVAEGHSFKQAIKTGRFWIFGLILFSFSFAHNIIITHIAPHVADVGISTAIAASVVSIFAATSLIGKNVVGFLSNKIGTRLALSACLGMMTLILIWLLFAKHVWMFYVFAVLYGIAYGGVVPLQNLIPAELFGLKSLGIILAGIMLWGTIGGALGAPLAGYIFDVTRSYSLAFLICIIICALAIIFTLILLRSKRKRVVAVTK